jgi:hypothetical protein
MDLGGMCKGTGNSTQPLIWLDVWTKSFEEENSPVLFKTFFIFISAILVWFLLNYDLYVCIRIYLNKFDVHVTVHRGKFIILKPTRCTDFSNLFWNENLRISDSSSVHHQEVFNLHTAMVYVVQICRQLACLQAVCNCCVYSEKLLIMDRGIVRNM